MHVSTCSLCPISVQSPMPDQQQHQPICSNPHNVDQGRELSIMHTILTDQLKKLGPVSEHLRACDKHCMHATVCVPMALAFFFLLVLLSSVVL